MGNIRISFEPDVYYHIYNHGNSSDNIFANNGNYHYFLSKYSEYLGGISDTFAYCLMPNHFHFLVRIKQENGLLEFFREKYPKKEAAYFQNLSGLLSRQYGNFLNAYARAYNIQQGRRGSLFLDNLQRKEITSEEYLRKLLIYIHQNPVLHGFVSRIEDWQFSSYSAFFSIASTSLKRNEVIAWFEDLKNFKYCHLWQLGEEFD